MNAGRELDALIAEQVMGWRCDPGLANEPDGTINTAFWYPPEWDTELGAWPSTMGRQQHGPYDLVPHYSTSIADAWLVVEKFREREIICQQNGISDATWVAFVWALQKSKHGVHYLLQYLTPESICLAALKAVQP